MGAAKYPDLVVLQIPGSEDERFVLASVETMLGSFPQYASITEWVTGVGSEVMSQPALTEADVRARLGDMGVSADDIDVRLTRARRALKMFTSGDPLVCERITRIGYRNADGQEVIGRTEVWGAEGQRVFVMRCGVCAHEYGSYGFDADIRRCPECQDGAPAIPL
jgi:hypothetical protein